MNKEEKQSRLLEIELEIDTITRKIHKIMDLPESKRKYIKLKRSLEIYKHHIRLWSLSQHAYIIQSQPTYSFESRNICIKSESNEKINE